MKKIKLIPLVILTALFLLHCESKSKNEPVSAKTTKKKLTKEQQLKKLYTNTIIPLFEEYKDVKIPVKFKIDSTDNSINAGAAYGYVEVSQGLVNYEKKHIQVFTLAHELGHIVTQAQAKKMNLGIQIPKGKQTNDYKKAEFLADLIAIHLIDLKLPEYKKLIHSSFNKLKLLLGAETFTHPSGKDRIKMMNKYLNQVDKTNKKEIFEKQFKKIWQMI